LIDERIVRSAGARLSYTGLKADLKPYIRDKTKGISVRLVAITIAEVCHQATLVEDLVVIALDDDQPKDVRVRAAFTVARIGDEAAKAALKRLATDDSVDDPDDQLKGCALAAAWPRRLTAAELFSALKPPKRAQLTGLYQQFLRTDIAAQIQPGDICLALAWAREHQFRPEYDDLGRVAISLIVAAIDFFKEPGVCESLATILVEHANQVVPQNPAVLEKLQANPRARRAIASAALKTATNISIALHIFGAGLVATDDVSLLLSEFLTCKSTDGRRGIASLIARMLHFADAETFDRVMSAKEADPILSEMLKPLLEPRILVSEESEREKADYEAWCTQQDQRSSLPDDPFPEIDDLIASVDTGNPDAFQDICILSNVRGPAGSGLSNGILPAWETLTPEIQRRVLNAAEGYLKVVPAETEWLRSGEPPNSVLAGYWALQLLKSKAPNILLRPGNLWVT
jgi:hypothetical protein